MTALYDEHAEAVLRFVLRLVPDRAAAEDVVQETFLRAWRRIDTIRGDGSPRAYLFTTARNLVTDRWRRTPVEPQLEVDAAGMPAAVDGIDAAMTGILVGEALDRLSADHRAVVRLLFFDGWSVAETATLLGVPPGTVKSRSYYAVRALRAALDELGVTR